jgi:hypothetical protein
MTYDLVLCGPEVSNEWSGVENGDLVGIAA